MIGQIRIMNISFFNSVSRSLSDYINSVVNDIKCKFKLLPLRHEPRNILSSSFSKYHGAESALASIDLLLRAHSYLASRGFKHVLLLVMCNVIHIRSFSKTVFFDLHGPCDMFENTTTLLLCYFVTVKFQENRFPHYPQPFSIELSIFLILGEVKLLCVWCQEIILW